MLDVQNVKKSFQNFTAVDGISFKVSPGEVVGFLGPNGAGKSTTMRLITGFLKPDAGNVFIANQSITEHAHEGKAMMGYLPESTPLYPNMVVFDFLKFMGEMRNLKKAFLKTRLEFVITQCELQSVLRKKIQTLSKGFKQRVGLAQALLHDPKILILDEPTIGLDPNQIIEIRKLIKDIGKTKTILLSTHILPEISATCSRAIIIHQGKIIAEGAPDVLTEAQIKSTFYHVAIRGEIKLIERELKNLPGYVSAKLDESQHNLHRLTVTLDTKEDVSERFFELAVENSWKLAELKKEKQNLENVFRNLTRG